MALARPDGSVVAGVAIRVGDHVKLVGEAVFKRGEKTVPTGGLVVTF